MTIDYTIGNPPYQKPAKGNETALVAIYHTIMEKTYSIGGGSLMIHPAKCLFGVGWASKWGNKLLKSPHFKVLECDAECKSFDEIKLRGGVVISYYNTREAHEPLGVFIPNPVLKSIYDKAKPVSEEQSMATLIQLGNKYDRTLPWQEADYWPHMKDKFPLVNTHHLAEIPVFTDELYKTDGVLMFGRIHGKRATRYIESHYLDRSHPCLDTYKIFCSRSSGVGDFGEKLPEPFIGLPKQGCTDTYRQIGPFDTYEEVDNCLKYIQTKFARALLSVHKTTQNLYAKTWVGVPLQDFSDKSDVPWIRPVSEIDNYLYQKYALTEEEIEFIEANVKEMT